MPPKRSLSDAESSQSDPKRAPTQSSNSTSNVKSSNPEPSPAVYGLPSSRWNPPAPPSFNLFGKAANSIPAQTTEALQHQYAALCESIPHMSERDWCATSYFQEAVHVVLNSAYADLYERHRASSARSPPKRSTLAPLRLSHALDLPRTPDHSHTPIYPLTPDLARAPARTSPHVQSGPVQPLPPLVRATAFAHRVSPPRSVSIPKMGKKCSNCESNDFVCLCVQTFDKGIDMRARGLHQKFNAMTTDELIRLAAKNRYAVVPIDAFSQPQFSSAMGSGSNGSKSVRIAGWQLSSAQRREVIGSESPESLVGGESSEVSSVPLLSTMSESEKEEQSSGSGSSLASKAREWLGYLFAQDTFQKRKRDDVTREPSSSRQGSREGSLGHGRKKRIKRA
ncbi:MAG: hypothetical protein BYD32DRAFT_464784 [Podila humilis]|nr:MAG: hypothetical protein BYD32DRAFT_464784 [Podila humilis]